MNNPKVQNTIIGSAAKYLPKFLPTPLALVLLFSGAFFAIGWIVAKAQSRTERVFAIVSLAGVAGAVVATVGLLGGLPQLAADWQSIWLGCWIVWMAGFVASIIAAEYAKAS